MPKCNFELVVPRFASKFFELKELFVCHCKISNNANHEIHTQMTNLLHRLCKINTEQF